MTLVISLIFLLFFIYVALIIYYKIGWDSIPDCTTTKPLNQFSTKISVIIPARNEAQQIKKCLLSVCSQTYPADLFEVIVVDDFSTDETAQIAMSFNDPAVKLIRLSDHVTDQLNSYKKKAIEIAIAQSTGSLIVTTDADCFMGKHWLQTIATVYETDYPAFIAAPVVINNSGKFIEIFQALDFMTLQGITGAAVYKKVHGMCNGANLAYEKKVFNEVKGFEGIDTIASGDDLLLMHKIAAKYPARIAFLKSREATVQTEPVHSIGSFFNQRIRWASKADKYNDKSILPVLIIVYFFNVALLVLPIICLFNNEAFFQFDFGSTLFNLTPFTCWVFLLVMKTVVEVLFLSGVAAFFNKKKLLWWFPVMQPFHIIYTVVAGWLGKFGTYQWKERKVT